MNRPPGDRFLPFPLTDTQQAYWVGRNEDLDLGGVGCHGYWEWDSRDLDPGRLAAAWQRVVDRHEMLRAVIDPDGRARVLAAPPAHQVPVLDLRDRAPGQATAQAQRLRAELSHRVTPADRFPLWDVRVTLLPDGVRRLHLSLDLLIADAWSYFQVLIPDLVSYYEDPGAQLPPIGLTFRDYVLATGAVEHSRRYQRSREYWMARLDDLPPGPDLPRWRGQRGTADRQRARSFTRREHRIGAGRWQRLTGRAAKLALTPSGLLVAVFAEVLRAWSASDQFTINFPLFGRMPVHPDADRLLGDFTSTSLLAVDKADGDFTGRAQAIQERLWNDLEHRHFSGIRVMRELARRRGAGGRADFPVVATFLLGQPPRHEATALGQPVYTSTQTPQVALDFQAWEIAGELRFSWDSLDGFFAPGLIADMFGACQRLLDGLGRDGTLWRAAHPGLLPPRQRAIREAVNATSAPVPDTLLHLPVAGHAAERPQATAVIAGPTRLSYAELAHRVNQVGRMLRESGAQPNELVAVVMDRGWEQVVAAHGVLVSGAAYLPISASVPQARLHHLLRHGEVRFVLTQTAVRERFRWPAGLRLFRVDRDLAGVDGGPVRPAQCPGDLAYVIYTSGSTGTPKGVMVDHRGAANTILDVNRRFAVGPGDRALALSGLDFDLSVYDLFGITAAGGTIVLPSPARRPDPEEWARLIAEHGVTVWNSVPTLMEILVTALEGTPQANPLRSLRLVILSGDWIPVTLPARIRALAAGTAAGQAMRPPPRQLQVVSAGGPTETCVWSIMYPVGAVDPDWPSIPYGRPMANQRYHILDDRLQPRPAWVPGEIHIESQVGLAQGYWRDAARTRERFFRLPGSGSPVYASGDLGRYLPDGTIEILGRRDLQVKIEGHRIEPGEIESVLAGHPAVRRAVVVGTGPTGEPPRRLAAFVTLTGRASTTEEELRRFAAERLPPPLVPAGFTIVQRYPLLPNGKVDRAALAVPPRPGAADAATGPAGPGAPPGPARPPGVLEEVVADLWAAQLGTDLVPPDANLLGLGADSITATRFIARVRQLLGVRLALRTVFENPTVAGICAALRADGQQASGLEARARALWALVDQDDPHGADAR